MNEALLTVKEYAALFRKHPHSVYRRIRSGAFTKYPIERDGRSVLIRVPADLIARLRRGGSREHL